MKYILILLIILSSQVPLNAERFTSEVDSLKYLLRTHANTANIAAAHGRIAWLSVYADLPAAFAHLDTAARLFNELNDERNSAIINYKYGALHRFGGDYKKAHAYMDLYGAYIAAEEDSMGLANYAYQKGSIYSLEGNFEACLKQNYAALSIYESLQDSTSIGFTLNNIGIVYKNLKKYDDAITSLNQSIAIHRAQKDYVNLPNSINSLGNVFAEKEDYIHAEKYYREALYLDSLTNNLWGIAINSLNIGNMLIKQKKYKQALVYLQDAYSIQEKNNFKNDLTETSIKLAVALLYTGDVDQSKDLLMTVLGTAGENSLDQNREVNYALYELYNSQDHLQKALKHYKLFTSYNDSIFEAENLKNIHRLQISFESAKKDKTLAEQQVILEKNRVKITSRNSQLLLSFTGLLILFGVVVGLWMFFYQHQKIKRKEYIMLQGQQEILQLEALIAGEEKEKTRLAQDLHDGINGDLAVIKYKISELNRDDFDKKEKTLFKEANMMLDNAVDQIRRISHNLTPPLLNKVGLSNALQQYCNKINATHLLKISFQHIGMEPNLRMEKQTALFRIIQELLNNTLKHANASEALVQISTLNEKIFVTMEDNGTGFNIEHVKDGIGLQNIRSRVSFLNATLDINSGDQGSSFYIEMNEDKG